MAFTNYNPYGQTSESADAFSGTTPLASQFYTGGQMGGFPQAQYMTPMQYGSFRTLPSAANMTSPGNMGMTQALMVSGQSSPVIPNMPFIDTYAMGINQQKYQEMARRKVADSAKAISGTIADQILSVAVGGVVTALTGGNFGLGIAAYKATPNLSEAITDRIRQTRSIQNMSMSKITMGPDVDMNMGQGFNFQSARRLDKTVRTMASSDTMLKQEDYRQIMNLGLEGGLFDYSSTSAQYGDKLKILVKNFKSMMDILETVDPSVVIGNMQRLQKMGVSATEMVDVTSRERMAARMIGISHSDMMGSYGAQGAVIYAQNGLSQISGSLTSINAAANFETSKRLGLIDPRRESLLNGPSGFGQAVTSASAAFDTRVLPMILPALTNADLTKLDPNMIEQYKSGKLSFSELLDISQRKLANLPADKVIKFSEGGVRTLRDDLDRTLGAEVNNLARLNIVKSHAIREYGNTYKTDPMAAMQMSAKQLMGMDFLASEAWVANAISPQAKAGRNINKATEKRKLYEQEEAQRRQEKTFFGRAKKAIAPFINSAGELVTDFFNPSNEAMYPLDNEEVSSDFFGNSDVFDNLNKPSGLSVNVEKTRTIQDKILGAINTRGFSTTKHKERKLSDDEERILRNSTEENGLDYNIFRALMAHESAGFTATRNSIEPNAKGHGQMFPGAAKAVGAYDAWQDNSIDRFEVGIPAAAKYFKLMLKEAKGDYKLALQMYHDGPTGARTKNFVRPNESNNFVSQVMSRVQPSGQGSGTTSGIYAKLGIDKESLFREIKAATTTVKDTEYEGIFAILGGIVGADKARELLNDVGFIDEYTTEIGNNIHNTKQDYLKNGLEQAHLGRSDKGTTDFSKKSVRESTKMVLDNINTLTKGGASIDQQTIKSLTQRPGVGVGNLINLTTMTNLIALPDNTPGKEEAIRKIGKLMKLPEDSIEEILKGDTRSINKFGEMHKISGEEMGVFYNVGSANSSKSKSVQPLLNANFAANTANTHAAATQIGINTSTSISSLLLKYGMGGISLDKIMNTPNLREAFKARVLSEGSTADKKVAEQIFGYTSSFGEDPSSPGYKQVGVEGIASSFASPSTTGLMKSNFGANITKLVKEQIGSGVANDPGPQSKNDELINSFDIATDKLDRAAGKLEKAADTWMGNKKEDEVTSQKTPGLFGSVTSAMENGLKRGKSYGAELLGLDK